MSKRVQKIKSEHKYEIIRRYQSLEDMKRIAASLGVSASTVKNWLVEWGEYETGSRFTDMVCELFSSGKSVSEIAVATKLSDSGVRGILKSKGVYHDKRTVNHSALSDLTDPNTLYWLGFICGDGCIDDSSKGRSKRLSITSKDQDIIDQFKHFFGSNHKVSTHIHNKNGGKFHRISFSSKKLCARLETIGITARKTHTLEISDQGLVDSNHFMRGIIDADGYISKKRSKVEITTGSKAFANQLTKSLERFSAVCKTREREGRKQYYSVVVGGIDNVKSLLSWLDYDKSTYALERKKKLALSLL